MADQLFKKRKARKVADLARKQSARQPYDKILIVCEGSKTEPNYLREMIGFLRLSTANVEVDGTSGSDPLSVVEHAVTLVRKLAKEKSVDNYDQVFCVFDKDEHEQHGNRYTRALDKISQLNIPGVQFSAITSVFVNKVVASTHTTFLSN